MASASILNDIAVRIANGKRYLASQQAKGNSQTAAGASAKIEQYEDQLQIAQASRYIQEQSAKGNSENVAGATAKLAEYNEDYDDTYNSGTSEEAEEANPEDDAEAEEEVKVDEPTGNAPLDNANLLSNILNSPLYSEAIKSSYLTDYLPGLTQSTYNVNAKRTAEVQNSVLRQQAQRRAVRNVAGDYASRGLRTPKMITEGIDPIQQSTERATTAAQAEISGLENSQELLYGKTTADEGSFISNPAAFGAIGAQARRAAVGGLQSQPQNYGLTQVANAATAPKELTEEPETAASTSQTGRTRAQIEASIAAADRYIGNQQAAGNQRFVTGGKKKRQTYQDELSALG